MEDGKAEGQCSAKIPFIGAAILLAFMLSRGEPSLDAQVPPKGPVREVAKYRPDRIIIKPKEANDSTELARFHAAQHVQVLRKFVHTQSLQVLRLPPGAGALNMVSIYQRSGLVEYAEPDYAVQPLLAP